MSQRKENHENKKYIAFLSARVLWYRTVDVKTLWEPQSRYSPTVRNVPLLVSRFDVTTVSYQNTHALPDGIYLLNNLLLHWHTLRPAVDWREGC